VNAGVAGGVSGADSTLPAAPLGNSGVRVTRLVFGGAPIGGLFAPVDDDTALATLDAAWAAGIRAFDTAPHYGVGLSERRFGQFLPGHPRGEYVLCTKVGRRLVPADGDVDGAEGFYGTPRLTRVRDYSRDGVLASIEDSLRRLGTDRVDIVLIHDPDDHGPEVLDGAYPALAELRAAGVIGAVGAGMNQVEMLEWFLPRTDLDCVLVAGRYTLLDTQAAESLLPECQRRGVGVLAGGVFNSGVLADPGPSATFDYQPAPAGVTDRARRIGAVCARYGLPIGAVALQFTLRHPAVTAAVVGARSPAEIAADVGYLACRVPDEVFGELEAEGLVRGPGEPR
jgi:D-threo-aldose 1-dehydrogenase